MSIIDTAKILSYNALVHGRNMLDQELLPVLDALNAKDEIYTLYSCASHPDRDRNSHLYVMAPVTTEGEYTFMQVYKNTNAMLLNSTENMYRSRITLEFSHAIHPEYKRGDSVSWYPCMILRSVNPIRTIEERQLMINTLLTSIQEC